MLATKVLVPRSGLEMFYFLANYKSFPEFCSVRMDGDTVLTDY